MKKHWNALLLMAPVLAILLLVPALTGLSLLPGSPLTPTADYSVYENRAMADPPELTAEGFWNGGYYAAWEDYFSDRFYGRDRWLRAHTAYMQRRGAASVNDVVHAGGVLLPQNGIPNYAHRDYDAEARELAAELKAVDERVRARGGIFLYVGVPEQRSMLRDSYPFYQETNAVHLDRTEQAFAAAMEEQGLELLLTRPLFSQAGKLAEHYSVVDHHYTLPGAYVTYRAVCDRLAVLGVEIPVVTEEHISFSQLENPFLGSYNRKLYGRSPVTEKAWIFASDMAVPFTRADNGQTAEATVFDLPEYTWQNTYYTLYMGGDKAETVIDTGRDDLPKLLIWGDSFTNAFETIAWMSFGETRALDFRYYTEKTLTEYIDEYQPDVVLCMRDDLSYLYRAGNGMVS